MEVMSISLCFRVSEFQKQFVTVKYLVESLQTCFYTTFVSMCNLDDSNSHLRLVLQLVAVNYQAIVFKFLSGFLMISGGIKEEHSLKKG